MRNTPERHALRISTLVGLAVLLLTGCSTPGGSKVAGEDMAGLSATAVAALSLEDEFNLFSERYEQMQAVLLDAQLQISDGPWRWNGGDVLPTSGVGGVGHIMPGSDGTNSYYMQAGRIIFPEGATGDEADLEPMKRYFDTNGWEHYTQDFTGMHVIWGTTDDDYHIEYGVQTSGQYYLDVYSSLYWTNNATELLFAISDRKTTGPLGSSLPGEYVPFPKWTDPIHD